jgi:hypothetical protein
MTEYLPAAHAMQSDSASLPIVSRYEPGGQLRHSDEPLMTEYLPAAHAMQSESASLPFVSRYVPGGQSRHVVLDDAPMMKEYLPAAHAMQSDSASLPIVSRYVPGGHSLQIAGPVAILYFPASQAVQEVLPTILQQASKPENCPPTSVVNTTCMYPVFDLYSVFRLSELTEPDSFEISTHEDDELQAFMVTVSYVASVMNDENERPIEPLEVMSQLQFNLSTYFGSNPSEIVPETVPVDGWHRQPPEQFTVVAAGAVHPALQVQRVKSEPSGQYPPLAG